MIHAHDGVAHRNYVSTGNLPLRTARSETEPTMDDRHGHTRRHTMGHRVKEHGEESHKHELRKSKSLKFRKIFQNVISPKPSEASPPPSRGLSILPSKSKTSLHDTERSHSSADNYRRKHLSRGESNSLLEVQSNHSRPRSDVHRPPPSSISNHKSSNNPRRETSPGYPYSHYSRNDSFASSHTSNFSLNKPLPPEPRIEAIPPLKIRKKSETEKEKERSLRRIRERGTPGKFFQTGTLPSKPSALDLKHLDDFLEDRGLFERERRQEKQGSTVPRDCMPPVSASSNLQAEVITITRQGGPAILFGLNDLVEDAAEERAQDTKEPLCDFTSVSHPDPVPETVQEPEPEQEAKSEPQPGPGPENKQESNWQCPELADHIVLQILEAVNTREDLQNTALINRRFYKVFKDNSDVLIERFRRPASVFLLPPSPSDSESPPLTSDSFSISDYQYNGDTPADSSKNQAIQTWQEDSQNQQQSPNPVTSPRRRPERLRLDETPPVRESRSKSPETPVTPGSRFSREAPSPPPSQLPPPPPAFPPRPDNVKSKSRNKGRRSLGSSRDTKGAATGMRSSLYTIDEVQDSHSATPRHHQHHDKSAAQQQMQLSDDSDLEFDETLRQLVFAPIPEPTPSRPKTPVDTETPPPETTVPYRHRQPQHQHHHHHHHSHNHHNHHSHHNINNNHHHHHRHHSQHSLHNHQPPIPDDSGQRISDDAPRIPLIIEPESTSFLDDIERYFSNSNL